MANTKICTKCKEEWFLEMFVEDETTEDGLRPLCKFCDPEYDRTEKPEGRPRLDRSEKTCSKFYNIVEATRLDLKYRYDSMKKRCRNPWSKDFARYGGRGIDCCFDTFEEFCDYVDFDLAVDPAGLHMHRIDNNDSYKRGNIEFLTPEEHAAAHARIRSQT